MTTASQNSAPADLTEVDTSARCPLLLLLTSGLLWLVVGGGLALLNSVQVHTPTFLVDCAWLTYGRLQAMQETALIYGWAGNTAMVLALWLLARLGGAPLRGLNYITVGALFWNLAITLALVGIAAGDATSFALLQMPRYVQPIMLFAFAAMAVPGVLAWTGRRKTNTFAAQWYAVAALFLFPWLFSVAQVILTFVPVRGTLQAVVATWYAQNVFSLWLAPVALAGVYYLLPKITGRTIPNYDFAVYGFWSLLFFSSWLGGRHLIGSPVPVWIPTVAIVCTCLVLFHHLILFFNLRGAFRPGGSTALTFLGFGLAAYLLSGLLDAIFAARALALITQFTYFQQAQAQLAYGSLTLMFFGALYYLAPRLAGVNWPSVALIRAHLLASLVGFALLSVGLAAAGWTQGVGLNTPEMSFVQIATTTRAWLYLATAGFGVLLVGNLLLLVHVGKLMAAGCKATCSFRSAATMEASVS